MKAILLGFLMLSITALSFQSCTKDPGFDGNRTIKGKVTYPDGDASNAMVYIKFNATDAATTADYTTVADNSGNYSFHQLAPGNYVVWAKYTSPQGLEYTTAGSKVVLEKDKGEVTANLELK